MFFNQEREKEKIESLQCFASKPALKFQLHVHKKGITEN